MIVYCHKDLTQPCKEEGCSRWTKGAGGEPGACIDNIQSQFTIRLMNVLVKLVVPMSEAFIKSNEKTR